MPGTYRALWFWGLRIAANILFQFLLALTNQFVNWLFHDRCPNYIENNPFTLLCNSMDWFIYDSDSGHEKVNYKS